MHSKAGQDTLWTFENHCLEEEMPFGDPFEDSGVALLQAVAAHEARDKERFSSSSLLLSSLELSDTTI